MCIVGSDFEDGKLSTIDFDAVVVVTVATTIAAAAVAFIVIVVRFFSHFPVFCIFVFVFLLL